MKAFVEDQAAKEGFGTTSEYLRSMIRDVQKRLAKQALEAKLLEGLARVYHVDFENTFPETT
jgi:antitoxin ParD1/3/4